MARIFSLIFFLIILVLGLFFGVLNADVVPLNYYWGAASIPLSVIIVLALILGVILGLLASAAIILKLKHRVTRLTREIRDTEKEVRNLRAIPIKNDH